MPEPSPINNAETDSIPQGAGPLDPEPGKVKRRRIDSVDLLRGIVMVIMMLDDRSFWPRA